MSLKLLIAFSALCCLEIGCLAIARQGDKKNWWKTAVFYQIYPRSFKDSNGDGIGDLKGILSKLDHLKDAGITAAWLSPIYKSPQVDGGYDISDYREIHEEYGSMEDFEDLIEKAQELKLKVVMDFVPNHSSDQHEWFKKSENKVAGFEDYYVWADGKNNDDITPPNNWISVFKNSAWQYSKIRKQWYLHQFTYQQPDLNFKNPKVIKEMKDIMKFWMDKGVYGFRIDAIPHLYETGMEDEPLSHDPHAADNEYGYLDHIYTKDQQGTYDILYEFREFIEKYNKAHSREDARILMAEAYTDIQKVMKYYGDGDSLGAHFSFNFELIGINSKSTAPDVVMSIQKWMTYMPKDFTPNWVLGNHDQHRIATRAGPQNADGFNMLVAMLPGVQVTYNGEEIAMEDGAVTWAQGQDPNACNAPPEKFNESSRDFERTPYHWDSTKNAGFSSGQSTWLPVSDKYLQNNLAKQKQEKNSHFRIYKEMNSLRRTCKVLQKGRMEITAYSDEVIVLRRYMKNEETKFFVFNISGEEQLVNLEKAFDFDGELKIIVSNGGYRKGSIISPSNILLKPHESFVAVEI